MKEDTHLYIHEANLLTDFCLYAFSNSSDSPTTAQLSSVIKQRMEKDVDEVGQIARSMWSKIEQIDREVSCFAIPCPTE